jgi:hypothetical protein
MSDEERIRILKMLEEGKISANDALDLLNAINEKQPQRPAWQDATEDLGEGLRSTMRSVSDTVNDALRGVNGEEIGRAVERAIRSVRDGFRSFHDSVSKEFNLAGDWPEGGPLPVEIEANNDALTVHAWSENRYEFRIEADLPTEGTEAVRFSANANGVKLVPDGATSLRIDAYIPAHGCKDLILKNHNDIIRVEGAEVERLDVRTTNDSIEVNAKAHDVSLTTTNDNIRGTITGLRNLTCNTTNDQIDLRVTPVETGFWRLATSNDSIRLQVASPEGTGFDIRTRTTNDPIYISLPGMTYNESVDYGAIQFAGKTDGYESAPVKISVEASTTNDKISIEAMTR